MATSPLGKLGVLPTELRIAVYEFVLVSDSHIVFVQGTNDYEPGLLKVSKAIRKEASSIFFTNKFEFEVNVPDGFRVKNFKQSKKTTQPSWKRSAPAAVLKAGITARQISFVYLTSKGRGEVLPGVGWTGNVLDVYRRGPAQTAPKARAT
ncbi:hypothetical protein LTR62_005700 [Meristemomyces frigidus]|uniref:Uncharacterized protein n=1 Tax=Meristemomyces frigidus TaxID=1508187 RepID=A0AAN7YQI2_9PEZI|nr:hypothetical protein LTR62_005700 [Meristemomyces frigidus]